MKTIPHKWLIFISISLLLLLMNIDLTAVNLALATIAVELHLNINNVQWIISAYLIGGASLVILGGHLGDTYGHKRIFLLGSIIFTIASLGIGLSTSLWGIVSMRLLQGFGAALAWPLAIVINRETFVSQESLAMGLSSGVMGGAMTIGPPLGGFILHYIGWRWIFFINIPICLVALTMGFIFLPNANRKAASKIPHLPSAACLFLGLLILIFSLNQMNVVGIKQPLAAATFFGGIFLLGTFIYLQNKIDDPLLDLRLFKNCSLANCFILRFLWQAIWVSIFIASSLLLQNILNFSALRTSIFFCISSIAFAVFSPFGGKLAASYPPRDLILTAFGFYTISFIWFATLSPTTPEWQIGAMFLLFGIGTGIGFPSLLNVTLALSPEDKRGMSSGILYAMLFSGGSIGAIFTGSLIGNIAPHVLQQKLYGLTINMSQTVNKILIDASTGVRDVNQLKHYFNPEQAKALIAIVQQSFFHAFMILMIFSILISLINARITWFIKFDPSIKK